ncbi:hypothetical protein NDU88_002441 [Pleurodeles waltl]|uniref:Uncharacterized protein n=1 Tax=Pleurodeles waltl TaxID=8319 RepID=A0AAV7VZD0_PLEWA|nr:hypothetical protein NDU88_002441 [Pleurodeles waltl]
MMVGTPLYTGVKQQANSMGQYSTRAQRNPPSSPTAVQGPTAAISLAPSTPWGGKPRSQLLVAGHPTDSPLLASSWGSESPHIPEVTKPGTRESRQCFLYIILSVGETKLQQPRRHHATRSALHLRLTRGHVALGPPRHMDNRHRPPH